MYYSTMKVVKCVYYKVLSGGFCPAIIPTHNPKLISALLKQLLN